MNRIRVAIAAISFLSVALFAYTVPTDVPESDGTLEWNKTLVLVRVSAGDKQGLGYTYAHEAAVALIQHLLAEALRGVDAMAITSA